MWLMFSVCSASKKFSTAKLRVVPASSMKTVLNSG
jgi:hypothetical protein